MDNAHKTRFSLRFPNIDFSKDFENPNSGLFKKLRDQVSDDVGFLQKKKKWKFIKK